LSRQANCGNEQFLKWDDKRVDKWARVGYSFERSLVWVMGLLFKNIGSKSGSRVDSGKSALPPHVLEINMPGIFVTIQDMLGALEKVGGNDMLKYVKEESDPPTEEILRICADNFDKKFAYSLGFKTDISFEQAVRNYKARLES
jgi:hypothetical protein